MRIDKLTPQQHRVAEHVTAGLTDKQIAARLHISRRAVEFHIHRITIVWELDKKRNRRVQIARRFLKIAA